MKITVGKHSFDNVIDFTTNLETVYEQDEFVSGEVSLVLECDALSQEHQEELAQFFLKPECACIYKCTLTPQEKTLQLFFDNVYLAAKRKKFTHDFQQELEASATLPLSYPPPVHKIRKAKKNWIEGTKDVSLGLQLRQQYSQHVQPQQQKVTLRHHKNEGELVIDAALEAIPSAELGELVDRVSIETARWTAFAKRHPKSKIPDLRLIWDRLVGKEVDKVGELHRKITHVQAAAMEQIIESYPEFGYGLLFENLPPGFYLQPTEDGKHVLCFSNAPQYQHLEHINPLTLIPGPLQTQVTRVESSYQQFRFLKTDSVNLGFYEAEFNRLFGVKTLPQERQKAFDFFLEELTESGSPKLKQIKGLLKVMPLTDLNYQGLAQVLLHAGTDGVLLLLHHLKLFQDKELLNAFNDLFFNQPEDYLSLISTQGFAHLKQLSELSPEQKSWWISLVSQHKSVGARTEFNELFSAYKYFLDQLEKKKLKLPLSCALERIRHMQPALERLLFLVTHSSDPEEQLTCLEGLDFDVHGAYYASRYYDYRLISRQMHLKPTKHEEQLDYSMPKTTPEVHQLMSHSDLTYEQAISHFYRFIGQHEWAFSLDVYQRIERDISANRILDERTKIQLLEIVVLVTTGQRACSKTKDPYTEFNTLLKTIIALKERAPKDSAIMSSTFSDLLAQRNWEVMPTVDALNQVMDVLLLPEHSLENPQELIELTFELFGAFDDVAASFIEHYKKRSVVEQTNTVSIQKFSFPKLLKHLLSASKLAGFLSGLFHDQPESLSQFIVLLSLLGDDVSEVTQDDEDDSEFETKVKALAQAIHAMAAGSRIHLFEVLSDINIEASYHLPTIDQLIKCVDLVAKAKTHLSALPGIENQKTSILGIVSNELPYVKIGDNPVAEMTDGLFSLMKKVLMN